MALPTDAEIAARKTMAARLFKPRLATDHPAVAALVLIELLAEALLDSSPSRNDLLVACLRAFQLGAESTPDTASALARVLVVLEIVAEED